MSNPVTIDAREDVPFIDITREFAAPVEALFRAHRNPELFKRWAGPYGHELEIEQYEFVTGGRYRHLNHDASGQEYAFNGVFHAVRDDELVIQTFELEGVPDVVSIESLTFEPLEGGRSRLTGHSVFPSVQARDGIIAAGMETGVVDCYEKLDVLLAET